MPPFAFEPVPIASARPSYQLHTAWAAGPSAPLPEASGSGAPSAASANGGAHVGDEAVHMDVAASSPGRHAVQKQVLDKIMEELVVHSRPEVCKLQAGPHTWRKVLCVCASCGHLL